MTNEEYHKLFKVLYEKNNLKPITLYQVGNYLNISPKTLRKRMRESNAYENCPDVFVHILKTLHSFDSINEESAYWIGYLMADGCFTSISANQNVYRLMLECKKDDKEILDKFCNFLGIRTDRITEGHNGQSVALCLADSNFSTSVNKWGILKNKSYKDLSIPETIKNNQVFFYQFLKGLVDGDGTVMMQWGRKGISIVSNSETLLKQCKKILQSTLPVPSSVWLYKASVSKKQTQLLYILKIGTGKKKGNPNIQYIFNMFYKEHKIILSRKYLLIKELGSL